MGHDIVNTSVVYDYDEKQDKTKAHSIIKTLRKLAKIENFHKSRPNPYAKYYSTQTKRKGSESDFGEPSQQHLNGTKASSLLLNGSFRSPKSKNPLNGLSSIQCKPLANGIKSGASSPSRDSHSPEKRLTTYRQSPRSLLKPKTSLAPPNIKAEKSSAVLKPPLIGYKIPKKKHQEQNQQQSRNKIGNFVYDSTCAIT